MLVRADHGGVGAERPVLAIGPIAAGPQPAQDLPPGPITGPAAMPVIDGLPVPEPLRQVPPRAAGPGPEEDPVDHHPVIQPPATSRRIGGHEHPEPLPFLIRHVVAIRSIKHCTDLHQPEIKIHGARPRPKLLPVRQAVMGMTWCFAGSAGRRSGYFKVSGIETPMRWKAWRWAAVGSVSI